MAGGFKLSLVPDVAPFVAGMAKAQESLEDTADSLDDLARTAQTQARTAGQDIAKGIDGGTEKATGSVDDLVVSFREMAKAGQRASKDTGDDIGRNIKDGTDEAEGGLKEFGEEANSTARETAASFDGSADSITGAFQEVAANAFAGFGPAGALAGLALAAGLGTFWASWTENAEKSKQTVSDMYQDMLDSGAEFVSKEFITQQISAIYDAAQEGVIKVKELRELANASDIAEPLLARALVGDEQARQEVTTAIAEQRLAINEALDQATAKGENIAPVLAPAIQALQDIEDRISGSAEGFTEAQQNAEAARAAIDRIIAPTQGVAASAEDARAKYNGLGQEISKMPTVITPTVDMSEAERNVREFLSRPRRLVIGVSATPGAPQVV